VVDETLNPDIDDIVACYLDQGHLFLVALAAGEIVGTGALIFEDGRAVGGPAGQLVRVSVSRDCRRLGLGRALVLRLIAAGRDRGLTCLWMETNDDWDAAIGLYRSCGFTEYDRRDGNIYMRLDLPRNPSLSSA
jgi:ribosomal protein S18 acetylase RimI-like enzyme